MQQATILTTTNILFFLTVFSIGVNVFLYFRTPQEKLDKQQAIDKEEQTSTAKLLAQQFQWYKESSEKRFSEMSVSMIGVQTMAKNDVSHVDAKVDILVGQMGELRKEIAVLSTKIDMGFNLKEHTIS